MKIAIIGSGVTGLSLAYFLMNKGHDITIIDKNENVGGLAQSFKINDVELEKYYHHFFKSDKELIELLNELGLNEKISFYESRMGFLYNHQIYKFNTALDLLRFSPLKFRDRIKLGLMVLYLKRKKDWKDLENITIKEWIEKKLSKDIYEIIWKPLLINKFGDDYETITASWLWGRIHPRSNSREKGKEKLGYLNGSFKILSDKLISELEKKKIHKIFGYATKIKKSNKKMAVRINEKNHVFDKVIFTGPLSELVKITKFPKEYENKIKKIKYQAIVCTTLLLKNPLSNIYWLNIVQKDISFGGIIEHTNLVPKEVYGSNLAYLFNYVSPENKVFKMGDKELLDLHKKSLKNIFPNFDEKDIINAFTFRNKYATPIYSINYSEYMPDIKTPIENLYIANTSQIYPQDRNINNSIKLARECSKVIFN